MLNQMLRFFAAPAEDKRVTAFETNNDVEISCLIDEECIDVGLRQPRKGSSLQEAPLISNLEVRGSVISGVRDKRKGQAGLACPLIDIDLNPIP